MCRAPIVNSHNSELKQILNEINSLSGYNLRIHTQQLDLVSNNVIQNLNIIRNQLVEYTYIRNKGFSADHLASQIGHAVQNVTADLKKLKVTFE